jgi:hypothetical protein
MRKKIIVTMLTGLMGIMVLTGCGDTKDKAKEAKTKKVVDVSEYESNEDMFESETFKVTIVKRRGEGSLGNKCVNDFIDMYIKMGGEDATDPREFRIGTDEMVIVEGIEEKQSK